MKGRAGKGDGEGERRRRRRWRAVPIMGPMRAPDWKPRKRTCVARMVWA